MGKVMGEVVISRATLVRVSSWYRSSLILSFMQNIWVGTALVRRSYAA